MIQKHIQKAQDSIQGGCLYSVATPIGNLADITLRALAVLQKADVICAEDTRVSAQLLSAYGLQGKLMSVREHNEQHMADKVIAALSEGKIVAQISDAGTPAICDPGAKLVSRVRQAGFRVVPVVGASAVMGALSVAAVSEPSFYFHGFLPSKSSERRVLFDEWQDSRCAIVAFETPHRIADTLNDMMAVFPNRKLFLAREITKTFETFLSASVKEIQAILQEDNNQMRGEMVLVIYPNPLEKNHALSEQAQKVMMILAESLPTKQAAELAAKITQENKKALYDFAIALKKTA